MWSNSGQMLSYSELFTSGMGVSEVTRTLVRDYGITRRSVNLDINWASAQMIKNLEKYEKSDLLAWLVTQTERVYIKAQALFFLRIYRFLRFGFDV